MAEEQDVDTGLIALAMHKLSIDNTNVTDVLTDCNIYLNKLNRTDLYKSAVLMDLNLIFDCLNTNDQNQIDMSCLLLQKLLSVLPPNYAFNKYSVSIERSLQHPNDTVKSTILSELEKMLAIDNSVEIQVDLACTIIDSLKSDDMAVSYNAVKCLKQFQSVETLSSLPILSRFQSIVAMDTKIRTRAYDILFHWAKSVEALALITSKGLFASLVPDITNPDIMMQMVTIQMLIPLTTTEHGFDYLNSIGIVSGLYRLLSSCPKELDDPSAVILNPVVLEFFIKITKIRPQLILTSYPKVFDVVCDILKEGDDPILVGVVIKGITSLASSWDCKVALDTPLQGLMYDQPGEDNSDFWSTLIVQLSRIAVSTKTELKAAAIQAIARIIQIEPGELSTKADMLTRTQKWYERIENEPIKTIVYAACKLPFLETQLAGFEMLQVLAEQPWGLIEINKCPSLVELVVEHYPADPVTIVNVKKSILKTLIESDAAKDHLNDNILSSLKNNSTGQTKTQSNDEVLVEDIAMQ